MWRQFDYKGFQIHVLPVSKYGPPPPEGVPYGYRGYVQRPGNVIAVEANVRRFEHVLADFDDADAAAQAAQAEGRSIIDGTHPELSVDGL